MRRNSQDAIREYRPYFDNSPVYGGGPSMKQYMRQTSLTVGSPQEVIDMAGLPLKTVLEQLDLLGEEVLPVLPKELAALRPA